MRRGLPGAGRSSLGQALALLVGAHAATPPRKRARRANELCQSDTWQYETEIFSGVVYRMVHPKIVLTIYHSGNVILTGGKVRAPPARAAPASCA